MHTQDLAKNRAKGKPLVVLDFIDPALKYSCKKNREYKNKSRNSL